MWLWKASHQNCCAQQVCEVNTKDLATAKPSREKERLKRGSTVACTDHNHRLYKSSLAPLLEKSSFWISESQKEMAQLEGWVWGTGLDVGRVEWVSTKITEAKEPKSNTDVTAEPTLLQQAWGK